MANTIKIKQSSVASKIPTTTQLALGELAVNTYDGKLYTKKSVSSVESIVELSTQSVTGIVKSSGITRSAATAGTDYLAPPSGTAILKANSGGALANAVSGTDYQAPIGTISGIAKGNGANALTAATAGTDYLAPPSGTSLLKANSGGALANAVAGTDYQSAQSVTGIVKSSGTTRSAAVAGTDYLAPPSGTAILKANTGGALANATAGTDYLAPPAGTSILKANSGGALANAVSGTDYQAPIGTISGIVKGNGANALTAATAGTDYLAPPSGTALLKANSGGALANAVANTDYLSPTTPALDAETFSVAAAVTAGTNAQGQGALTKDFNIITTATSNPSGVTLPTATTGRRILVVNKGANPVNIYPATGAAIDAGGANVSTQIPVSGYMEFIASSTTQWYSTDNITLAITSGLSTGILKNTTTTGALSVATAGTDYQAPIGTISGIAKGNGANALTAATAGTDYLAPPTGTAILKANAGGALANAVSGTDYQAPIGTISGLVKGNGANALTAAVAGTDYQTAQSVTGLVKSTGTTRSAAVSGTDYAPATSGSGILKGNGAGGFATATSGTDYAPATSGTSVLKGNGSGGTSAATAGTDYSVPSGTETLTNKRITARVLASTANSATPTLNTDSYDMMVITGQSVAITSFTTGLTGTPTNGQKLWIAITGTGAIAITWGTSFEASTVALPTTTVSTNRLDIGFVWNAATSKWRCMASA